MKITHLVLFTVFFGTSRTPSPTNSVIHTIKKALFKTNRAFKYTVIIANYALRIENLFSPAVRVALYSPHSNSAVLPSGMVRVTS